MTYILKKFYIKYRIFKNFIWPPLHEPGHALSRNVFSNLNFQLGINLQVLYKIFLMNSKKKKTI